MMGREAGISTLPRSRARSTPRWLRATLMLGGENRDKSADQQTEDWERIKAVERGPAGGLLRRRGVTCSR
ncbi:MAG: hypothetical protein R3D53_08915 [Paracoccaceae bacterium]